MRSSRRNFIKKSGIAIGGVLALPACYHKPVPFRYFTQSEANCLMAICECIIPADDAPGATDAGVIYYIDKQIMGHFKKLKSLYREGLNAFQKDCAGIMGTKFELLNYNQQIEFLELIENNNAKLKSWTNFLPSDFFNTIIAHTMQGFYGAPRHGGNKNYLSYQMLGIGYPQIIGQNRYTKADSNG